MRKAENSKNNQIEKPKKNLGGRRPGSGRKPGQLGLKARTALEIKNRIAEAADNLLNAELVEALGSLVVMKADPENPLSGMTRVTDEDEIVKFIQEHKGANGRIGNHVYILTAKDGNYKSRQYLFDRAFGRPSQAVEVKNDDQQMDELAKRVSQEVTDRLVSQGVMTPEEARVRVGELYPELVSKAVN
jgi:hypothetical protein